MKHALLTALPLLACPLLAPPSAAPAGEHRGPADPTDEEVLATTPMTPERARATFDRLRALEGSWGGASSQGWTSRTTFEVIARGTVVMQSSHFEAHPGEKMVTMYHLHAGELLVTHYCVAGNQPRLAATGWAEDGDAIQFTFRDGTGLADRDQGHMDSCVLRFEGPEAYSSRWTWYQDGAEKWMEEIHLERQP